MVYKNGKQPTMVYRKKKRGKEEKIILSCMEPNFLFKGYFMYFLYVLICPDFLII